MNVRLAAICLLLLSIFIGEFNEINGLFDPLTGSVIFGAGSAVWYAYEKYWKKCEKEECCEPRWRSSSVINDLQYQLDRSFYGQHIAAKTVINALSAHIAVKDPPKALTMSFHGLAGSGKNYLASMIVDKYYRKGRESLYYTFFNGRSEFPLDSETGNYKKVLRKKISNALRKCPESIFVFDEVDMMAPGVLNAIVPFLDYSPVIYHEESNERLITHRAIYIFLSNTGSQEILKTLVELWEKGKHRQETKLSDFENLISLGAFNEKGGFHKSDTISTSVIDHYVPFLPMEQEHVIMCIKAAFSDRGYKATAEEIDEVLAHVTFGPPPHNLYAKSGCKRLEQKVASVVFRRYKD